MLFIPKLVWMWPLELCNEELPPVGLTSLPLGGACRTIPSSPQREEERLIVAERKCPLGTFAQGGSILASQLGAAVSSVLVPNREVGWR